jgi:hypothetical protein
VLPPVLPSRDLLRSSALMLKFVPRVVTSLKTLVFITSNLTHYAVNTCYGIEEFGFGCAVLFLFCILTLKACAGVA